MDPAVVRDFEEVVEEAKLPYKPVSFQRVGAVALGGGHSVIMVIGTGEGKMTVPLLAAQLARRTQRRPKGVTVITQPLTGLMLEQLSNPICPVAVLSMAGEVSISRGGELPEQARLSCSIEDLIDGKFPVIIGHPESFSTPLGQRILGELQRRDQILQIVIDEFHTNSAWSKFRPALMKQSCGLRAFARKGAPVCIMTATATEKVVREVVVGLGLERSQRSTVMLVSNPVQEHIKMSVIKRPSNAFGIRGKEGKDGQLKPGLWALLHRIYFKDYFKDVQEGRQPKKALIFTRGMRLMVALHSHICSLTGQRSAKTADCVMVHGDLTPPTEKVILGRMDDINVFLATTRMLLGLDLSRIDVVIFLQPFDEDSGLLQGGGRGGRRKGNGFRCSVQVYQLFNAEDLSRKNKHMSEEMRQLCRTGATACTRDLLTERYRIGPAVHPEGGEGRGFNCCHHHDLLAMDEGPPEGE
jgi:superfamily II DNA helicase RecQ